jgi:BMFP domain-containing protein YqiC
MQSGNHIETLIQNLADSFNREMGGFRQEVREELRDGLSRIESVVERHSKMIVAGTASISALTKQMTRLEALDAIRARELSEVKTRLRKLEAAKGRRA